jgi:hypothetical protein
MNARQEEDQRQVVVQNVNALIQQRNEAGDIADMGEVDALLPEHVLGHDEAVVRQRAEAIRLRPLRDRLRAAVHIPRMMRVNYFEQQLRIHRNHPEFRLADEPMRRLLGFSCTCGGSETLVQISLASVRELMPEALGMFQRIRNQHMDFRARKSRKKQDRAEKKARTLLFRHLTRPEKWHYRAYGHLRVTGGDGHTYEIEKRGCTSFCPSTT